MNVENCYQIIIKTNREKYKKKQDEIEKNEAKNHSSSIHASILL